MPMYKGSTKISVIKNGSVRLKKVYHGSTLMFGKEVFRKVFTSSGNITFPTTIISLKVIVVGGGAGIYKSGIGGVGGKTSFMSITATGGNPTSGYSNWGTPTVLGQGGIGSGGDVNKQGNPGQYGKVASPGWEPAGGIGWNINGVVYGSGGNGGASIANGHPGQNGCVYIEYTY